MKKILFYSLLFIAAVQLSSCSYNRMVGKDESCKSQWGNVQSAYQRRSDLIPNLVNTVKGYADFEQATIIAVTEARSKATSIQIDPSNITPEQLKQFEQAQSGLSSALSRLLVSMERYPDLKANQNFLQLQSELEGTENRINVERNKFNEVVKEYNSQVRGFPALITAKIFGFKERAYFESTPGSEVVPTVDFKKEDKK